MRPSKKVGNLIVPELRQQLLHIYRLIIEGLWAARRAAFQARATRVAATLAGLGVTPLISPSEYSSVLWSYRLPAGMTYARLHAALKKRGFIIYAGQGRLAPDIFRIAHMGDIRDDDLGRLDAALRSILGGRRR